MGNDPFLVTVSSVWWCQTETTHSIHYISMARFFHSIRLLMCECVNCARKESQRQLELIVCQLEGPNGRVANPNKQNFNLMCVVVVAFNFGFLHSVHTQTQMDPHIQGKSASDFVVGFDVLCFFWITHTFRCGCMRSVQFGQTSSFVSYVVMRFLFVVMENSIRIYILVVSCAHTLTQARSEQASERYVHSERSYTYVHCPCMCIHRIVDVKNKFAQRNSCDCSTNSS